MILAYRVVPTCESSQGAPEDRLPRHPRLTFVQQAKWWIVPTPWPLLCGALRGHFAWLPCIARHKNSAFRE
jgi:hypothetical protein